MKKTALFLTILLAFTVSCKKTVDSELKSWDANLKNLKQLTYEYPSFKSVIEQQMKAAESTMTHAKAMTDEKQKIEKMSEANSQLRQGFIRNLKNIKNLKETLRSKAIEVKGLDIPFSEKMAANRAVSYSDRMKNEGDTNLKSIVTSTSDAEALSSLVLSDLKSAESGLDKVVRAYKSKKDAEKKKADEKKIVNEKEMKQKTEAAKPIKCPYCGTENPAGSANCKSCGAPFDKK